MEELKRLVPDSEQSVRALKIFIFFLLIFTLFLNWGNDNAWSRYDLTAAMAEDGSVKINNYSYNTVDKRVPETEFIREANTTELRLVNKSIKEKFRNATHVFRTAESVYSDKAPLTPWLAVPGYITGDIVAGLLEAEDKDIWLKNDFSNDPVDLSFETSLQMFLIVLTVSAAFGAGLMVLLYRHLQDFVDEKTAFYTAIIAGVGSPLFTYSTSFFGVINAAFLGFASFLALEKFLNSDDTKWVYIAGLLSALAVSAEYYAGLIPIALVFYLYTQSGRSDLAKFGAGAVIGSVPMFIYHWLTTGHIQTPPIFSPDLVNPGPLGGVCTLFPDCYIHIFGFRFEPLRIANASIRLLFYPTRGLFFYSPILLLAIPGIHELYRRKKEYLIIFPGAFLLLILFQAARVNWLAGISFGPRYAIAGLPFLVLPVALGLKKLSDRGRYWQIGIALLFLLSVFNVLLGFGPWGDLDMGQETYVERMNSMEPVSQGIYSEKIENFQKFGPRSETLMSLTDRYKGLDITYMAPYGPHHFELLSALDHSLLLSTNLLPVAALSLLTTGLIWRRGSRKLRYAGAGLTVLLLLLSLNISSSYVDSEIYRTDSPKAVNGSMNLVTYGEEIPHLELVKSSPRERSELDIYVNGDKELEHNLTGGANLLLPSVESGRNKIRIEAEGCTVPGLFNESLGDNRCLSFRLANFSTRDSSDFQEPALVGFYNENISEDPWMSRKGELIYSSDGNSDILAINLKKVPFFDGYSPEFYVNGRYTDAIMTDAGDGRRFYLSNASLEEGINYIEIRSESCRIPARETDSTDDRCLSYQLQGFKPKENLSKYIYSKGWHDSPSRERWMKEKGELLVNLEKSNSIIELSLQSYSEIEGDTAEVFFNGRNVRNISLEEQEEVLIPVKGDHGLNNLEIRSRNGCRIPAEVEESSTDTRCLSLRLEGLNVSTVDETRFRDGWFREEETRYGSYRWMTNRSFLVYNSTGADIMDIDVEPYDGIENSTLEIFAGGEKITEVKGEELDKNEVYLETDPGVTTLRLESSKGCEVPALQEEDSTDYRCLSFRFNSLEIDSRGYGYGWHSREGDSEFSYRWMKKQSSMVFASGGGTRELKLEAKPYRHLEDPELEISLNGEKVGTMEFSGQGRSRKRMEIDTEKGINTLRLESLSGCEIPSEHERLSNDRRCLSFQFNRFEID